jgi:hypothetical protein
MALISPYLSESLSESHEQLLSHQSPLRNHSEEEMPNLKEKSRRKLFIFFLRLLNGLILLTSISLLLYSLVNLPPARFSYLKQTLTSIRHLSASLVPLFTTVTSVACTYRPALPFKPSKSIG